jgi:hypothetical protein
MLLWGNLTNAYISYQSLLPKSIFISLIIRYVSLKNIQKISLNPTSSPRLEPSAIYGFVALVSVISLQKQRILFFVPFFYLS